MKRFLLILTIAALVSAMLAIGAPSVTAQQGQGGGTRATVSCAPEWLQEWHQWYDRGSSGGISDGTDGAMLLMWELGSGHKRAELGRSHFVAVGYCSSGLKRQPSALWTG